MVDASDCVTVVVDVDVVDKLLLVSGLVAVDVVVVENRSKGESVSSSKEMSKYSMSKASEWTYSSAET